MRLDVSGTTVAPADRLPVALIGGQTNAALVPVVTGLTYATVSDGWATFVSDADLTYGGAYRVMLDLTSGTTFNFTRPGKIAFDTVLCPFNGTVTAVEGLRLTHATSGTVTTYMADVRFYLLLR
jgi:branched-subunit amino acid permease